MYKGNLVTPKQFFSELVDEGFEKRNLKTYPAVKTYLVNILEHYVQAQNLFEEEKDQSGTRKPATLAEMYLTATQAPIADKANLLKKLGDSSLYISGFFGDSLARKIVDIDYYAQMGGAAYSSLAECVYEDTSAQVYRVFAVRFLDFVDVLTYISHRSMVQTDENILRLYDRYIKTGSPLAKEKLIELGILTTSDDQMKLVRQD